MSKNIIYDLYLQKVADTTGIPVEYVTAMRDNGMMNQQRTREILIRHDYHTLTRTKKFSNAQIITKLAVLYDTKEATIRKAIKIPPKHIFYCSKCGKQMSKLTYQLNDGICDRCISKSIKI